MRNQEFDQRNLFFCLNRKLQSLFIGLTLFLAIGIVLPLYAYKISKINNYSDFDVYYRTAVRVKNKNWSQIYDLRDGASPFRYPPFFLPFFRPLAELSPKEAQLLWFFIQYASFCFGFYWLYRTLKIHSKKTRLKGSNLRSLENTIQNHNQKPLYALTLTCFALLFTLRFCLDTFTIGQVSSLMFLGFSFSLYTWTIRRQDWSSIGLIIPSLFKIGPGFLYGVYLSSRTKEIIKGVRTVFFCLLMLMIGLGFWLHSYSLLSTLWNQWSFIVSQDSNYYDSSHYGSQSINSFLLRLVKSNFINLSQANSIHLAVSLIICIFILLFWILRRPTSLYGRSLFFSLGLFAYFWVMPETFKYSFTPIAIPVALLAASPTLGKLNVFILLFGILTLSLPGKDIVGDTLFFGLQFYSIPLVATFLLAFTTLREAWIYSKPSNLWDSLAYFFNLKKRVISPWKTLPKEQRDLEVSVLIPVPFLKNSLLDAQLVESELLNLSIHLHSKVGNRFEIILIPWGNRLSSANSIFQVLVQLEKKESTIQILYPQNSWLLEKTQIDFLDGRGAALQRGFLASRGKKIIFHQLEQPCQAKFFLESLELLDQGYDLVRANRRLPKTHFEIPVKLLKYIYRRHRLGLYFNHLVRFLLPIKTTDTLSGSYAISQRLAKALFALQTRDDFLFDLELSIIAFTNNFLEIDLPVSFSFEKEKSIQRIAIESLFILKGLPRLYLRFKKGYYRLVDVLPTAITADDWGLSPGVNQGILALAKTGVIKRVSIMANASYLEFGLSELKCIPGIELGIHFNLTYGRPSQKDFSKMCTLLTQDGAFVSSPFSFLLRWLSPFSSSNENKNFVRKELFSQLTILNHFGISPSYLDGHHHIHLVPKLIDSLADIIHSANISIVRLPYHPSLWFSSRFFLACLARYARPKLVKFEFKSLPIFYPTLVQLIDQGFLLSKISCNPKTEIIVHPAESNDLSTLEFQDTYTESRVIEFLALRMLNFLINPPHKESTPNIHTGMSNEN